MYGGTEKRDIDYIKRFPSELVENDKDRKALLANFHDADVPTWMSESIQYLFSGKSDVLAWVYILTCFSGIVKEYLECSCTVKNVEQSMKTIHINSGQSHVSANGSHRAFVTLILKGGTR